MEDAERIRELEARVRFLEQKVRSLRASRRVLMDLLAVRERDRRARLDGLERENRRLRQKNGRYARSLLACHIACHRMEEKPAKTSPNWLPASRKGS